MSTPSPTPEFRPPRSDGEPSRSIDGSWPLGAAAQMVALEQVEAMNRQLHALLAAGGADVEAVHGLRVACRRLRTAMDALAGLWPRKPLRRLRREVSTLASACGRARDLDVELARWARRVGGRPQDERERALRWLWSRADGARRAERGPVLEALEAARTAELLPRLEAFFSEHPVDLPGFLASQEPFGPRHEVA